MNHFKNTHYHWHGKNQYGQLISGEISAYSINLVRANLQKKGIQATSISKKKKSSFQKKISQLDIILFFRQLATLTIAGIPISQAIQLLNQNEEHTLLQKMLSSMKDDISAGNGLAYAMQKFPYSFDDMTRNLIVAGEKSGTLDIMLERIAQHKERLFQLKNKIKQALFYPATVLSVAIIVTSIMLVFVVPRFTDLFHNMHAELPLFTVYVIHLANFLKDYWYFIIMFFIAVTCWLHFAMRKDKIKRIRDSIILSLPIIGISMQKFILSSWARSLTTIFAAGIPITEALKILTHSTGNMLYRNAIQDLYLNISAGKQLHFAMQNCKLFPIMMIQMIQIGEESGTLEKMLTKIADFYESDLDRIIGHLSRLLEPLIMIILGVVIGGLVIAMYLPIFKLGTVI